MKCFKKIFTCAIVATVLLSICTLNVFAEERSESETSSSNFEISFKDKEQQYDIERIISETFGDVQIESSDFLYSLDDSEDFVYADFVGGGYAIFLKNTMELLECSDAGSIDFVNSNSLKYYGGSGLYFSKLGNNFVDETTGKVFEVDEAFASEFSQNIRNTLLEKNESNNSNIKFDFSTVGKSQQEGTRGAPTIDDDLITYTLHNRHI